MKTIKHSNVLILGVFCVSSLLGACVDEELVTDELGEAEEDEEDEVDIDPEAIAFCAALPIPAPYDKIVLFDYLSEDIVHLFREADYGTTSCASSTTRFYGNGDYRIGPAISPPTTAEACVALKMTITTDEDPPEWRRWTRVRYGEWDDSRCILPVFEGMTSQGNHEHVTVKVQTTTCSGIFCAVQYGRPFYIVADPS